MREQGVEFRLGAGVQRIGGRACPVFPVRARRQIDLGVRKHRLRRHHRRRQSQVERKSPHVWTSPFDPLPRAVDVCTLRTSMRLAQFYLTACAAVQRQQRALGSPGVAVHLPLRPGLSLLAGAALGIVSAAPAADHWRYFGDSTTSKAEPLIRRNSSCIGGIRGSGATEMSQSRPLSATNIPYFFRPLRIAWTFGEKPSMA